MMKRIVAFDTSLVSENGGDDIIREHCEKIVRGMFPDDFIVHIPTHDRIGDFGRGYGTMCAYKILYGTNILTSRQEKTPMWAIKFPDIKYVSDTCLMGAGWREYEGEPTPYTKYFWNHVLSHKLYHSVRDRYTEEKLKKMGFDNVIYTGCPTMWDITKEKCRSIPKKKADKAITTLTNYRMGREDIEFLDIVARNYDKVYIWIQALQDYKYLMTLPGADRFEIISPGLDNLDKALRMDDVEYCGTRLHSGVRAINFGLRTTIVAKDNRALEIGKDTGLNVIDYRNLEKLEDIINGDIVTDIHMPFDNIEKWKGQFK